MHVVIAGGSGFVGKILQDKLIQSGHRVTVLTRDPSNVRETDRLRAVKWLASGSNPELELEHVDAIVNLAGESINGIRWTKAKKTRILNSRIHATREIVRLIGSLEQKPSVLVNASAVGYYGMSETEVFTESAQTSANDFLASVVRRWEEEASQAEKFGVRTVYARLGIVLGNGGALPLMALPYKMGIGGTIGSGNQWVSWIHVEDAAGLLQFAIEQPNISGPLNVVSPDSVLMKQFGKIMAEVLRRPHWLPVPAFLLKAMLGEMSDMLARGQKAIPEKAERLHYAYKYEKLPDALRSIFQYKGNNIMNS